MSVPETIAVLKDLVLAGAGVVAAVVAVKGLSTWRRQLRGSADFECARALARATYKVRDAVQQCRSPWMDAREFPPEYYEAGPKRSSQQEAEGLAFVYRARWKPVVEAWQDLEARTLEGEALWGPPIRNAIDSLRLVLQKVNAGIEAVISNARSDGEVFKGDKEFAKEMRAVVSSADVGAGNQISTELSAAVKAIEEVLKPHLSRQ